jgi:hypothetical protein
MPPFAAVRNLTLFHIDLALRDLFETRKADLDLSVAGKVIYGPQLAEKRALVEALPSALKGGRPNAEQLADADARHDALGGGIWLYTEAVLTVPDVSEEARASAKRVRAAFLPERSQLADPYMEEAARAKRNRPRLSELEKDLEALPIPDGKTLYNWVSGFLDAGDTLDELLRERASVEAGAGSSGASELRTSTIGLLGRLRSALRDEVKGNPALPRDLETRVFCFIDELSTRRRRTKGESNERTEPAGT